MTELNTSGFRPKGPRCLILMDKVEDKYASGIIRPSDVVQKEQNSETKGQFISCGDTAFVAENFNQVWAVPGDRGVLGRFVGQKYIGVDGKEYRIIMDADILGVEE